MSPTPHDASGASLGRFNRAADTASTEVIRTYSTSFGLATRLLGERHRQHVRNIYAMVRIADEIVDGVAAQAGLDESAQTGALASYVAETHRAMDVGYSTDLVLHAFARTARECGIGEDLTQPFFDSMAADIAGDTGFTAYDAAAHERYVYGSAEVVGLMCLRVFLREDTRTTGELETLTHGARQLGAAFQNVNFLRDLADDTERLQRGYLGDGGRLTDADRDDWVRTITAQLDDAARSIPLLPKDARAAVRSAHALFAALTRRVAKTPASSLYERRVRVPDPIKALLATRSVLVTALERNR
ncbi:phytoene synthase [Microbacterium foliorum]|jgi:phytoene synthase|uniref:Phytoene synthase n=1 Tax=Microbacterium foliorum TaxID=104336 RepID=A0ABU1HQJ9_9MICO|nr:MULTISPECIES: squalene/phytoene synthase family protein [Microbacterium]AQY02286.1 phytoene synthase [Microbacterium foliorum]KQR47619.1 phytoene synthase [Microbacterium sp. Leaf161]MDR6142330.1 phytoene synthase [Microbacterium foliorum]